MDPRFNPAGVPSDHGLYFPPTRDFFEEALSRLNNEVYPNGLFNTDAPFDPGTPPTAALPVNSESSSASTNQQSPSSGNGPNSTPNPAKRRSISRTVYPRGKKSKREVAKETRLYACERPIRPDCASSAFGSRGDRNRHYREVHGIEDDGSAAPTYPCPDKGCTRHAKPFQRRQNLQNHIDKFHSSSSVGVVAARSPQEENSPTQPSSGQASSPSLSFSQPNQTIPPSSHRSIPSPSANSPNTRPGRKRNPQSRSIIFSRTGASPFERGTGGGGGVVASQNSDLEVLRGMLQRLKDEREGMMEYIQQKDREIEQIEGILNEKYGAASASSSSPGF